MAHSEAICNVLVGIATKHDVDCIAITDADGVVLVDPIFGPNAPKDDDDAEAHGNPTNAVLSFAQAQKHLAHLPLLGTGHAGSAGQGASGAAGQDADASLAGGEHGVCLAAQYRDHVLVQFADGPVTVTLTSRRTMGRCLGGLLALVPVVRGQAVYRQLCAAVASDS